MAEISASATAPEKVKLRVVGYLRLGEVETFETCRDTELLDDDIVDMDARYRPHARMSQASV